MAKFQSRIHELALAHAEHLFRSRSIGTGRKAGKTRNILPDEHFAEFILLESRAKRGIEEPVRFGEKRDDGIGPAAVRATASVREENYFGLAVAVEVLAGVVLVENHAKPSRAEHHVSADGVDRRGAPVAIYSTIARRAQRNLVAVPKFFGVGLVLRVLNHSAMAGNLASQVVLCAECRHRGQNHNHREENSSHAKSVSWRIEFGVGKEGMVSQQRVMMTKELAARIVDFCAVVRVMRVT